MSPFMTIEVLMTESAHRDERSRRSFVESTATPTIRNRRSRRSTRERWNLRTLFRSHKWTSQSV